MIDPHNITNFRRSQAQLEELLLFAIAVAGKSARHIAAALAEFLAAQPGRTPLAKIRRLDAHGRLLQAIRRSRLGKHRLLCKAFRQLARSGLDLRTCTCGQLEAVHGVGPKTARFFLLHSRPGQKLAVLDTHVLKFMKKRGYRNIPASTPAGRRYAQVERQFIGLAERLGRDLAAFDLWIWRRSTAPA